MATQYTSLLGLALPVTGELSGSWGDVVNDSITSLLDSAVSGTTTLSADADVTLTDTDGVANQARQAILLWTATGTTTRNITAPAQSKAYFVVNKTGGTQSIVIRGAGPTTGVTVLAGTQALVVWNGVDFVEVASGNVDGPSSATDNAVARFDGTTGKLIQNSAVTIDDSNNVSGVVQLNATTVDATNVEATNIKAKDGTAAVQIADTTGVVSVTAAPILTALTANQAVFTNGTKALVSNAITGTGNVVMSTSPTLVTPILGTPTSGTLTNATGLPISTGVSGLGTGVATALAVNVGTAGSPVVNGGALGTPSSGTMTNVTGLPISTGVSGLGTGVATFLATPSSANLASAVTDETGTGALVFATSPTLVTPILGTPTSATLTNATGLPISTGVSGLGTDVATFLATPSSANLASAVTDETGSGSLVFATSPTLVTPNLGTPSTLVGTNITGTAAGLTAGSVTTNANLTGAVTSVGNATSLGSFTSAQLAGALTDETGSGSAVFATSPTLVTPILGTPTSVTLTNATGLPISTGVSGLGTGVATALAVNVGTAGSPVVNGGALGTPSSGTVTNLTGTASININGTVGATTANTGAFTTLSSTGNTTLGDASADTVTINGTVQPGVVISGSSAGNALRITQTGAGNALLVEDDTNPDSTPVVIDASGRVIVGSTTNTTGVGGFNLQLAGTGSAAAGSSFSIFSNTNASGINRFTKSRSATLNTNSIVLADDFLGATEFCGADGTTYPVAASIAALVDGTPGTNDMPGRLVFSTTADGASTATERVRISSTGQTKFSYNAVVEVTDNTNAALRVTQLGTGNALLVEDAANPDATPVVITSAGKTGFATLAPAATVHVAGDTILSNVNVIGASYDSVSFSVAGEETGPTDLFFSPDGLKMFVIGSTGDDVNEYNLSTAWVISSAVFVTNFSVASQDTSPQGLFFRADGTKMYVIGASNDAVFQYTLSTPWSVATASYDNISFSVAVQETLPAAVVFKPNGLSMYIVGTSSDSVYQYTLSTAWSVSTAAFLQSFSIAGQETLPNSLAFTGDGTRMFVMGQTGDDVNVYNLTTPWDISTATFVNVFSVSGQDTAPTGLYIKPDGTKMYMVGSTNDTVYQYTVPSIDIQLTGPTSAAALDVQQDLTVYGKTTGSFLNNGFRENIGGQYYNLVSQADIGTAANEIPLNQYLGALAYEDTETPALNVGTGITTGTGTICKANGGLMGGIYQMTILIDLTGLNSGGTAGDIIGVNGTALPCYIAQLPAMTVLGGRMTCLELPAGGDTDIDLYSAAEGTGVEDQAITALTETEIINGGTQALGTVTVFSAYPTLNQYLYLVGQSTSNATYTAGRFLIEIFGVQ